MTVVYALLLILVMLAGFIMTVLGLPGNWVMVAAAVLYMAFAPVAPPAAFGWPVVAVLVGLAILGEVIEFVASALGVAKGGGSRRGAVLAIVGSVVGAIVGAGVGIPIPVIGSLVAAVLFAAVGAMVGAMLGEHSAGRDADATWQVGKAAFWGRLLGTLAKATIAAAMILVTTVAVLL